MVLKGMVYIGNPVDCGCNQFQIEDKGDGSEAMSISRQALGTYERERIQSFGLRQIYSILDFPSSK